MNVYGGLCTVTLQPLQFIFPGEEEEQYLQNGDLQVTEILCCFLLLILQSANLSSWMWLQFNYEYGRLYVELQFNYSGLTLPRDIFPLESLSWTNI